MSPEEASRERAALPSLPPRRRTGANLIRSNRASEEPAAPVTAPEAGERSAVAAPSAQAAALDAERPVDARETTEVASSPGAEPAPALQGAPEGPAGRSQAAPAPSTPARGERPSGSAGVGEEAPALSRWDQLNRRIFSVADPQVEELVGLRKALMRLPARQRVLARDRERITESTLVRIGIDLVLRQRDQIEGVTEDELRASLGLEPLRLRMED